MTLEKVATMLLYGWRDYEESATRRCLKDKVPQDFLQSISFRYEDDEWYVTVFPQNRFDYIVKIPVYGEDIKFIDLPGVIVSAYYSDPDDVVADLYRFEKY